MNIYEGPLVFAYVHDRTLVDGLRRSIQQHP